MLKCARTHLKLCQDCCHVELGMVTIDSDLAQPIGLTVEINCLMIRLPWQPKSIDGLRDDLTRAIEASDLSSIECHRFQICTREINLL